MSRSACGSDRSKRFLVLFFKKELLAFCSSWTKPRRAISPLRVARARRTGYYHATAGRNMESPFWQVFASRPCPTKRAAWCSHRPLPSPAGRLIARSEPIFHEHEQAEREIKAMLLHAWPDRAPDAVDASIGV